jgi:hypothetical protein
VDDAPGARTAMPDPYALSMSAATPLELLQTIDIQIAFKVATPLRIIHCGSMLRVDQLDQAACCGKHEDTLYIE